MNNITIGQHISQQYNKELEDVRNLVMLMGGLVEEQLSKSIDALVHGNDELAEEVIKGDDKIDQLEKQIDEECTHILAKRQPAASDLRLVMAIVKTITDLERIGDDSERIARMALDLSKQGTDSRKLIGFEHLGIEVAKNLHDALDAFARMDAEAAAETARRDIKVDAEYEALMRQLITFMMEDARDIPRVLDVIWSARSLERIGDHARNICEYVVYLVKGTDVRHVSLDQMERAAKSDVQ